MTIITGKQCDLYTVRVILFFLLSLSLKLHSHDGDSHYYYKNLVK